MARGSQPQARTVARLQLWTPQRTVADRHTGKASACVVKRPLEIRSGTRDGRDTPQRYGICFNAFALGFLPALDHGLRHGRSS
ncbi:hypothetical protein [Mesorhizobium sp.]|uniref:hypothetical protein n=1 Tax=Mesorhizobium sp. TaxID=1871066 RepID=UPI003459C7F6